MRLGGSALPLPLLMLRLADPARAHTIGAHWPAPRVQVPPDLATAPPHSPPPPRKSPPALPPRPPFSPRPFSPPPPSPPASPPASPDAILSSNALALIATVACGVLGLAFAFFGQFLWREFLGLASLGAAGGVAYHLCSTYASAHAGVPHLWLIAIICCAVGLVAALLAYQFADIALVLFSGAGGGVIVALIFRTAGDGVDPIVRLAIVIGTAVLCAGGSGCLLLRGAMKRDIDAEDGYDDPFLRPRQRWCSPGVGSRGSSPTSQRVESVVTAVLGSYGLLFCLDHWMQQGLDPTALFGAEHSPPCRLGCVLPVCLYAALAAAAALAQLARVHSKLRARRLEGRAELAVRSLHEPLAAPRGGSALARRMRAKYCGGGEAHAEAEPPPRAPPPRAPPPRAPLLPPAAPPPPPPPPPAAAAGPKRRGWFGGGGGGGAPAAAPQEAAEGGGGASAWAALTASARGAEDAPRATRGLWSGEAVEREEPGRQVSVWPPPS
ncbi:hypothetical protein AB1Y20_022228 [Prymnesium parvum]|uniref:DUF4203 domain-containing protein n=1 Tax=Prymnesium parvum TaxID=97485 RepID=A0AB34JFQ4_PRYPA